MIFLFPRWDMLGSLEGNLMELLRRTVWQQQRMVKLCSQTHPGQGDLSLTDLEDSKVLKLRRYLENIPETGCYWENTGERFT